MSSKVIFLLALLCVSLSPAPAAAHRPRFLAGVTGDALVQKACRGVGKYEPECLKILRATDKLDKGDSMDLAFFTLRYVESHAYNLTVEIKKAAAEPDLGPMFQSALAECMEQYIPLDDLVEDGINAMLAEANSDSRDFIDAAITSMDICDGQLQSSYEEEKADKETKSDSSPDFQIAEALKQHNEFLRAMLKAALNIIN
ncbi:hypothetical protein BUALT_Bualt02G0237000 [Buddleja alternifolia]|uniref:Pectinesterase inhibitor domain-containing protein n=1 Tax=Buddleja alternifolia TaxID=168488 RepID=A0AAV6Y2T0_9LAMI|nr:hypothetical protein BUALT_Bualt02G0237000 [Buddleja alternifolia]